MPDKLAQLEFRWGNAAVPAVYAAIAEVSGALLIGHNEAALPKIGGGVLAMAGVALNIGTVIYGIRAKAFQASYGQRYPEF